MSHGSPPAIPGSLRILLNPCGSAGDVHPHLAIGKVLQERGHEVLVLTNPCYEEKVEREGLRFVPIGERLDWDKISQDPKIHKPGSAWKEVMGWAVHCTMRETYGAIEAWTDPGRTVVAAPVWSFGARIAREKLPIRLASIVLNPVLLRSTIHAPRTPQCYMPDGMPRWMKAWQYFWADILFVDPLIGSAIRQFRRELDLPKTTRRWMNRWWFSPDRVLGLFHEFYVPPQRDWPAKVELVGPTAWDPSGDVRISEAVVAFAKSGSPPWCFVPGSVGADRSVFQVVSRVCRQLGQRVIMLHGSFPVVQEEADGQELRAPYAPLGDVLPNCRALLHCGCVGTAVHALRSGIPQLVWPRVNDQFDMAQRMESIGVGQVLWKRRLTEAVLKLALQSPRFDGGSKPDCQRAKEIMLGINGTQRACDFIQRLGIATV